MLALNILRLSLIINIKYQAGTIVRTHYPFEDLIHGVYKDEEPEIEIRSSGFGQALVRSERKGAR
jgi:hypothetical protein